MPFLRHDAKEAEFSFAHVGILMFDIGWNEGITAGAQRVVFGAEVQLAFPLDNVIDVGPVSYTHLRAHET